MLCTWSPSAIATPEAVVTIAAADVDASLTDADVVHQAEDRTINGAVMFMPGLLVIDQYHDPVHTHDHGRHHVNRGDRGRPHPATI